MKTLFLNLIFILFTLQGIGQTIPKLQKFYYNLPIDSCKGYITAQIVDINLFKVQFPKENEFRVNRDSISGNQQLDSVILKIECFAVAIGGSPNQISPIVYEQWLTNTFYFDSNAAANEFLLKQKTELEPLTKTSNLNDKNRKEIEYVFMLDTNVNLVSYRQIHLALEKDSGKVTMTYRLIYSQNYCNCD